jgi:hypothetical protein
MTGGRRGAEARGIAEYLIRRKSAIVIGHQFGRHGRPLLQMAAGAAEAEFDPARFVAVQKRQGLGLNDLSIAAFAQRAVTGG